MSRSRSFCASPASSSARRSGFCKIVLRGTRRQAFAAVPPAAEPIACFPGQGDRRHQPLPARAGHSVCVSGDLEGETGQHAGALSLADEPSLAGGHSLGPGLLLRGDAHGPAGRALVRQPGFGPGREPSSAPSSCGSCLSSGRPCWRSRSSGLLVSVAAWGSFSAGGELRPAASSRQGRPGDDLSCGSLDREHVRQANDRGVVRFRVLVGVQNRSPGAGGGHALRHGPSVR